MQDEENGAEEEEVESEEDSGIQSKEELPHSPNKRVTPTKAKSNGGERLAMAMAEEEEMPEQQQPVRSSGGDGSGGRKKVGQP